MKRAGAYKRDKNIYLYPMSKTTTGLWIGTFPGIAIDDRKSPLEKGKSLREVLQHSREGLPHPRDWDALLELFLKEVGAKSWSAFAKNALSCAIDLKGDQLVFLPYRNSGAKNHYNFLPLEDRKMSISSGATDEELGLLLEKAFDACE